MDKCLSKSLTVLFDLIENLQEKPQSVPNLRYVVAKINEMYLSKSECSDTFQLTTHKQYEYILKISIDKKTSKIEIVLFENAKKIGTFKVDVKAKSGSELFENISRKISVKLRETS